MVLLKVQRKNETVIGMYLMRNPIKDSQTSNSKRKTKESARTKKKSTTTTTTETGMKVAKRYNTEQK